MKSRNCRIRGTFIALGCLVTGVSAAQFSDYRPPGTSLPDLSPVDREEQIRGQMESARWEAGPLRIDPWLGIRNIVFVTGVGGAEEDAGFSIGAGLSAALPIGPDWVFRIQAAPEYVFWVNESDRRTGHQRFSADLFGFYNRLTLYFGASRLDDLSIITPQVDNYSSNRTDSAATEAEIRVASSTYVFAGAGLRRLRNLETDNAFSALSRLDRDESYVAGGVRIKRVPDVSFDLGVESLLTESTADAEDRSNSGTYPFIGYYWGPSVFTAQGRLDWKMLDPEPGSLFVGFEGLTGFMSFGRAFGDLSLNLGLSRRLAYSLGGDDSHSLQDFVVVGGGYQIAEPINVGVFFQTGEDDYFSVGTGTLARTEEVESVGLNLGLTFGSTSMVATYSSSKNTSKETGFSSRTERLQIGVGLSVIGNVFDMK